ncbi:MAG: glucose-1-phosphate adenylyltransferase [Lachnospiraceae bacterium]|uniref:Glucose-1-phosphate adenylyltransferase n=1 Tax=Hominisplanchenecus murintestinalis TaxID=2941517 RepID=A0AC61R0I4_9FIRM|nr:glucose-1-phosphate adenylyltransferase [Hominisplanchenecus murintestinalis]MCI9516696.1 glucose-1-phosphate adenylyltransferase [Lachnospiraceae bacterium]RKJ88126.1 glucose-1-phosphate adenylyltransferase [Anaerotruncus sp. 1XD22-93]MCI9661046.1 glucose-1-phosphate adenylyltransferase [Lachnospiraceae bacterium]NBH98652.1 glucose-1-phosphate adenylyltransferase [Lachnospiraceae bacterium]NBI75869.1 glucose-1-phosphate adenylyltransferase [Lachnospiraceae bacterium]
MIKKEMIAMLLAGGQGSRLGVLTSKVAKPAVAFGGKYRIIDFPLSNCINSGVDTVGVLTQYQPLRLNTHIGIGIPWDLDKNVGGVSILPPYEKSSNSDWYTGTANAIYQNLDFMELYNPEYVLILSGDHIYKMAYEVMLEFHKANNADVSIAVMPVPMEEASRFGVVVTDDNNRITEFQEKPEHPKSNLASMGIYIFSWKALKEALVTLKDQSNCDFGKHIIPYCHEKGEKLVAYEYNGYWKDVGTLGSYWEANMELIDIIPEFNLYEEFWKVYTNNEIIPPQYVAEDAVIDKCIIGDGSEIYGEVHNSVIGAGVTVGKGAVVRDSIIMRGVHIGENVVMNRAIVAENTEIGKGVVLGEGENVPNKEKPHVYSFGLVTIGENTVIPDGVKIGKNTAVSGKTTAEDYPGGILESGETLNKAGEVL